MVVTEIKSQFFVDTYAAFGALLGGFYPQYTYRFVDLRLRRHKLVLKETIIIL